MGKWARAAPRKAPPPPPPLPPREQVIKLRVDAVNERTVSLVRDVVAEIGDPRLTAAAERAIEARRLEAKWTGKAPRPGQLRRITAYLPTEQVTALYKRAESEGRQISHVLTELLEREAER